MYTAILEGGIAYVQVRSMLREPDKGLARFRNLIEKERPEPCSSTSAETAGGSDNYWQSLVAMLSEEPCEQQVLLDLGKSEYLQPFVEQKGGCQAAGDAADGT
jgi:hypothetical protein